MSPDVAASVRARLLAKAKERREEFERTLTRFTAERWLYRLGISEARERCVLKGASLVAAWLPEPYRVTRDVDMLARGPADDAAIRGLVETVCAVPFPEDGVRFDLSALTLEPIRADEEYAGTRARFVAFLANARIRVQLDFGVGDALTADPEEIDYPTILESLPRPRVRAYPREASVAEKFQAMVALDDRNSRMKDFHDLWALSGALAFDGVALGRAISACFARRQTALTSEAPGCLTPGFYQDATLSARWRSYLASSAVLVLRRPSSRRSANASPDSSVPSAAASWTACRPRAPGRPEDRGDDCGLSTASKACGSASVIWVRSATSRSRWADETLPLGSVPIHDTAALY